MPMKEIYTTAIGTDNDGKEITVNAITIECDECGCDSFRLFYLEGNQHIHYGCSSCGKGFCNDPEHDGDGGSVSGW